MCSFIVILETIFLKTHKMDFFFHHDSLDLPTQVYSSVLEISNHTMLDLPQLAFYLFYSPLLVFLLNFLFFSVGTFCRHFYTYQPPPIARNNDLRFSFWLGLLGSSTEIFWKNYFMKWVYKWQRSKKLFSKAFSQQPIKYMVTPSHYNSSVVEVVGSGQPPPLLPSSQLYDWCYISYSPI